MPPNTTQNADQGSSNRGANYRSYQDFTFPSQPSTSHKSHNQAVDQSLVTTFQDTHNIDYGTSGIVNTDQQSVNWRMQHTGPEVYSGGPTAQVLQQLNPMVTMFQDAQHLNFSGNARIMNIGHQHVNSHGNYCFDNLKEFVSFNAFHDSSAQDPERCCHPGTRESVLCRICDWADDPSRPERILWLHGPAGVGKSAIAQTISNSYGRDKIGATFFFFRSDPMRNDGKRLFPTLAWRLASSVPIIKDHITSSLEEDPDIPRKVIEAQFEQLIARPSLKMSGDEQTAGSFSRVIIIDGLDECTDMKLQERILKIIGNAVTDTHFPFRFILSSRPEANIQDFFNQFQSPTLQIDLANIESAFHDIEVYFTSQFARIAAEQELDPILWPGQDIINTLVSKSSGQFIYASTVIKYVGDQYENAVSRLNIILQLEPSSGKSPFSELDALYTEILQRQPDKKFLKDYLTVLIARIALAGKYDCDDLYEDDAMLLGLDEKQLHRKLRGMHSILIFEFEPYIDIHHKSFLDFLDDLSRSGEYHISKRYANRRYLERVVDVLIKAASRAMEEPEHHQSDHFQPQFSEIFRDVSFCELAFDDLEEILHPLELIQDKFLQLCATACNKCWTFFVIDDLLLHFSWFQGTTQSWEPKYVGIRPLTTVEEKQNIPHLDLDTCLSLLLANLRCEKVLLNADTIRLVRALVRFDPKQAAIKVGSRTDAQNLVDLFFCLNKNGCFRSWFGATAENATKLALAIYERVPLLPRPFFLNSAELDVNKRTYQGKAVELYTEYDFSWSKCFIAFFRGYLSHENLTSFLGICSIETDFVMVFALPEKAGTIIEWRWRVNPSVSIIQRMIFEIATTFQYICSLGIEMGDLLEHPIYVDFDNQPKILASYFVPIDICEERFDYEGYGSNDPSVDVCRLGSLFCYILLQTLNVEVRPKKPEIPDNVWQLIQWCCAEEPEERPTIDQVVQEMESWISLGQITLS